MRHKPAALFLCLILVLPVLSGCVRMQPEKPVHGAVARRPLPQREETAYILNRDSGKFHLPDCPSARRMKRENRQNYTGSRDELIRRGWSPCGWCCP